jgi:hypothetical protein
VFTDPLIDTNALSQFRENNAKAQKTRHTDKSRISLIIDGVQSSQQYSSSS